MENAVAIVGMACRVPGSKDIIEFWDNIKNGRELISDISEKDILESGLSLEELKNSNYIKRKGLIENIDYFDAEFFNYSPKEAKLTDPQQRIALETCYHAMEDYGFNPNNHSNNIGVFLSSSFGTYLLEYLSETSKVDQHQLCISNSNDFLATRIAYKLNFTGPAQTIQTACSSSLVAVHYACQSVLNYDCDAAIAGGVSITIPNKIGYTSKKESIASNDGHCRPFDESASGTVPGNGIGVVVLKRLEDALASNDRIYAVIKGSAINNDGSQKMGFTAPSAEGQAKAIIMAQSIAEVSPDTIGLIESHGTATILGDPIEIEGLKRAFNNSGKISFEKDSCAITSTKANIGHLDAAAGVIGLIKATLSVYNKQIPPSINFTKINPHINLDKSPFYINTELKDWSEAHFPRRAGVSAFGMGGTNVHMVIEENNSPENFIQNEDWKYFILPISAKTEEALDALKENISTYVLNQTANSLVNIAYTLQSRKIEHEHRVCGICFNDSGKLRIEFVSNSNINIDDADYDKVLSWLQGEKIDWTLSAKCTSVPLYPFKKTSFWLNKKPKQAQEQTKESQDNIIQFHNMDIKHEITKILADLLEVENLDTTKKFTYIGADSLMLLGFQLDVQKKLNIEFTLADLEEYDSIDKLAEFLSGKSPKITEKISAPIKVIFRSLVVNIKDGDDNIPPLWCIHPAGGSTTIFQDLSKYINHNQKILGIRASGLYAGEIPDTEVVDMAQKYLKEIRSVQPSGPYFLLGGSLGGTIAFEIAQCLEVQGEIIALLGMMDSPPPAISIINGKMPETNEEIIAYINSLSPSMAASLSKMILDNNSSQDNFFKLWNCHKNSAQRYVVHRPYQGSILYFRAKERDNFLGTHMELDWFQWADGGVELYEVPGNHLTMYQVPNIIRISEIINRKLNKFRTFHHLYYGKEVNLLPQNQEFHFAY